MNLLPFFDAIHSADIPTSRRKGSPEGKSFADYSTATILGAIILLLTAEVHAVEAYRLIFVYVGTIVLLLLTGLGSGFVEDIRKILGRGPNPFLLCLLVWSGYVVFAVSGHRSFEMTEILRLIANTVAFLITGYMLRSSRQPFYIAMGLAGIAIVVAISSLFDIGQSGGVIEGVKTSFFATHEEIGSLVMMPLPIAFAVATRKGIPDAWRTVGMAIAAILGIALLVAQCRSAWVGGAVSLLVCGGLSTYSVAQSRKRSTDPASARNLLSGLIGSPVFIVLAGLGVFILLSGSYTLLRARAQTIPHILSADSSTSGIGFRLVRWAGATRMLAQHPVSGWGLGEYPVIQGRWSHAGDDTAEVLAKGTGHQNIAHNYYVQWAAETGTVGLALHIAIIAAFLITGWRAIPRLRDRPEQQALLIGCLSAVVAASVDAIGSPSYNFHGLSAIFWTIMGIGIAAQRKGATEGTKSSPESMTALPTTPALDLVGSICLGGMIAFAMLLNGRAQIEKGKTVPRGKFEMIVLPSERTVTPNTQVAFLVIFHDEEGKDVSTIPGTTWKIDAEPGVLATSQVNLLRGVPKGSALGFGRSVLQFAVPATVKPVTVTASYYDQYDRLYTEAATMHVRLESDPIKSKPISAEKK